MENNGWPTRPGVPLNAEKGGWHWVTSSDGQTFPAEWRAAGECERGRWAAGWIYGENDHDPATCAYIAPCLTPSEQSAREAAAVAAAVGEMQKQMVDTVAAYNRWGVVVDIIRALPIDTTALDRLLAEAREEGFKLASDVALAAISPSDGAMYSADFKAQLASHHTMERVKARLEEAAEGYGFCARSTPA